MPAGPDGIASGIDRGAVTSRQARLSEIGPARFRIDGDLTLAGVAELVPEGRHLAAAGGAVELSLGGIGQGSSAAVALLLEWLHLVRKRGGTLTLTDWPDALARIAALSNVDELLGIDGARPGEGPMEPPPDG